MRNHLVKFNFKDNTLIYNKLQTCFLYYNILYLYYRKINLKTEMEFKKVKVLILESNHKAENKF